MVAYFRAFVRNNVIVQNFKNVSLVLLFSHCNQIVQIKITIYTICCN